MPFGLNRIFKEGMIAGTDMGATDVYEKNNNVITETNLAGFNPEDVEIEVEDNCIKISAKFSDQNEERKEEKEAKAEYADGILKITVPKREQKETVKLKITK